MANKLEELYFDISQINSQINEIIDKRMKKHMEEYGQLDIIWALNVGFSSIFSSLLNFLDCLECSASHPENVDEEDNQSIIKIINDLKSSLLEASDVHKYFKKSFSNAHNSQAESIQ